MKYLGEKSLSSVVYGVMIVSWYILLFGGIIGFIILSIGMFSEPVSAPGDSAKSQMLFEFFTEVKKDPEAWKFFSTAPAGFKVMALMMLVALDILLMVIVKKAQKVFKNFKSNIVFHAENVAILSKISKLLIVFSIFTVNFSSLLVSIILLIFADVFKNGAILQEEHEYTV